MKQCILLVLCLCATVIHSQTFQVGHMSINFKDPGRTGGYAISGGIQMPGTGRDVGTEVYYPANTAGNNVAVAAGQFPVIVFGHGFVMTYDNYDNIYNDLAARGYIVLLPRTEGNTSPNHGDFGKDLALLASQGLALNTVSTPTALTTFNGKITNRSAIGGHSMGGGSSFLGAQNNSTITCLFNMAAAQTNPRSILAAKQVTVPTLILSGQRDCVADTAGNQNQMYDSTASSKKFQVIIKQMTHCDFGNGSSTACVFGESSTGCGNQLANALAFSRYMTYLRPFLDNQLKNDCAAGQLFMDSIQAPSSLRSGRKITGTLACVATGINEALAGKWAVYPNPASDLVTFSAPGTQAWHVLITDNLGRTVAEQMAASGESIDASALQQGLYFITISSGTGRDTKKFVKQ